MPNESMRAEAPTTEAPTRYDQKLIHVLKTSAAVFAQKGYHSTSMRDICARLPAGAARAQVPLPSAALSRGLGWAEGWRGEVVIALELGPQGRIVRCHPHDPSWQNWPVLEHAVIGNIVPDFPLINKSFNLSYSGHDL